MPDGRPCSACSDVRAIEHLIHEYARLIDLGAFDAVADLFAEGEWFGRKGATEIRTWFEENVILYDGLPRTQHVVSNIDVVLDGDLEAARAHSYITVFQQASVGDAITAITANFYVDTFAKRGGRWSFATRSIYRRLVGDVTQHRRS
jgi:hypothetical protein